MGVYICSWLIWYFLHFAKSPVTIIDNVSLFHSFSSVICILSTHTVHIYLAVLRCFILCCLLSLFRLLCGCTFNLRDSFFPFVVRTVRAPYLLGGWYAFEQSLQAQTFSFLSLIHTGGDPNKGCFISVLGFSISGIPFDSMLQFHLLIAHICCCVLLSFSISTLFISP